MAHALPNRVANPVLRRLLRTAAGRRLGRSLAVLRYSGRRTGQPHELVCQYARDGGTVWILVGDAGGKTWWRSLRGGADVEIWLAGERLRGRARAVEGASEPDEAVRGLRSYLATVPAARRAAGLPPGATDTDLAAAAGRVTLVRVTLL